MPALEALWRRFAGFDIEKPLAEQIAVLETLAQLDSSEARATLRRILLRNPALVGTVIDVLRDMECPRAARLARRLEREVSTGT